MTAVTPSTNRDSPWITWAGVETGAKMFVGLNGDGVDCAEAVAAPKHRPTRTKRAVRLREWFECVVNICLVENAPAAERHGLRGPPWSKKRAPATHSVVVRGRHAERFSPHSSSVARHGVMSTR